MRTAFVGLVVFLAACGSSMSDSSGGGGNTTTSTTVTSAGGTAGSSDGQAVLTFPAGAVTSPLVVTTTPMTNLATDSLMIPGTWFEFGPTGTQFAKPVTIQLHYNPAAVPASVDPSTLRIYYRNGSVLEEMPDGRVDVSAHIISAVTTHFSGFVGCPYPCGITAPSLNGWVPEIDVQAGASAVTVMGTLDVNSYSGPVSVTFDSVPAGVSLSAAVSALPAKCATTCVTTVTITASASANAGGGIYSVPVILSGNGSVPTVRIPGAVSVAGLPGIGITLGSSTASAAPGGSGTVSVNLTRSNYSGSVTLSASALPNGVTAAFAPATLTGSTSASVITFTVGSSVASGSYPITITASGAGVTSQSQTVTLNVVSFTLAGTPASVAVSPGGTATTGIKAIRNPGFVGTITYTVSGLPAGLTGAVTLTSVTDSSTLTITATGAVAPGSYSAIVTGTAGSISQQVTIAVAVSTSGVAPAVFNYAGCPASQPIWFAVQDGTGAWTVITPNAASFTVPGFTSGRGAVALVSGSGTSFHTAVAYLTQAELIARGSSVCSTLPSTGAANGSVAGIATGGQVFVSGGAAAADIFPPTTTYQIGEVAGTGNLLAYYASPGGINSDRLIFRRGVSYSNGVSLPLLDFASSEAVPPAIATLTVQGAGQTDVVNTTMSYAVPGCTTYLLNTERGTGPSLTISGIPSNLQAAGELHSLSVQVSPTVGSTASRYVSTSFTALSSMTVTLGGNISPVFSTNAAPYKAARVSFTMPSDYNTVFWSYNDAGGKSVFLSQSSGYANGSQNVNLGLPDFSTLSGFQTSWEITSGTSTSYSLQAQSEPPTSCSTPSTVKSVSMTGTN